jgi:putative glutamine amidotransferase
MSVIGITLQRYETSSRPAAYGRHIAYFAALGEVGLLPIGVPSLLPPLLLRQVYERLAGVLLPGGPDVNPQRYGEDALFPLEGPDDLLDEIELQLAGWCLEDGKPILGICRGMQVLNIVLGGSLYQDLESQKRTGIDHRFSEPVSKRSQPAHDLLLADESWLSKTTGRTHISVNSMHHQGVKQLGKGLKALGWAPDGLVEALWMPEHPFAVGFQFHLEEMLATEEWSVSLLNQFVAAVHGLEDRSG